MYARAVPLLVVLLLVGCAGSQLSVPVFQAEVAEGDFEEALALLQDAGDRDDVARLLDEALLLQALEYYEESNAVFERVEILIEDLYTRSLSKDIVSILTSDRSLDYRAARFEFAYVAYYRAWSYLHLGRVDDVLVEARRIGERLDRQAAGCDEFGGACGHDVFLRYFCGLLYEWAGEPNDAFISYKLAHHAREAMAERFGVAAPPDLGVRLVRLALSMGFLDEAESFRAAYGVEPGIAEARGRGSVAVFFENGMIGRREETNIVLPIFKGETRQIRGDPVRWAHTLADRAYLEYDEVKLDYLLRVALPVYVETPPLAREAEVRVGSAVGNTGVAAPLSAMGAEDMREDMPGILLRATARALSKYLVKEAAEKNIHEAAGILVNLLGIVLEGADTRSWRSLPYEIQYASFDLPPGTYEGALTVHDVQGSRLGGADYPAIEVLEGGVTFVRHRSGY